MSKFLPRLGGNVAVGKRWWQDSAALKGSGVDIDLPSISRLSTAGGDSDVDEFVDPALLEDGPDDYDPLFGESLGKEGCASRLWPSCVAPGVRARIQELVSFAGWHILGIPSAVQLPFLWYVFWEHVCRIGRTAAPQLGDASPPLSDQNGSIAAAEQHLFAGRALILWLIWAAAALHYRRAFHARAPAMIRAVIRNLEMFVAAGLTVTMSANICSMLHTPAAPLFDLGFTLIPAQSENSPWRRTSDVLCEGLPAVLVVRTLFMRRSTRCQVLVNWLRLVSLAYIFRALTVTLTSLPGPAPHCNTAEGYHPPANWHDIATRLGPMVGDYSTCGDLIFSGHTAFTTMTMLCLVKSFKGQRGYTVARILGPLYVGTMCTLALAGRKHYSVDIVVALLVSCLTFYRFQDGWKARNVVGDGLSDAQLTTIRKNTLDLPLDAELGLPTPTQPTRQSLLSRAQFV